MSEAIKHLADYGTGKRYRAVVVSTRRITPEQSDEEVRELVLDIERPDFPYKVGQSIAVLAPGSPEFGHEHHLRLYSVADLPERGVGGKPRIKVCVRRCSYIDQFSGEEFPGIASHFLCDRRPGDSFLVTGPFGLAFEVPEERDATLILIGSGTGIAPFRAFVKHIYRNVPDWKGTVWLLYGAKSPFELLYMNDEETFEAFKALSPRPNWADPIGWDYAIRERSEELWERLGQPKTYVYLAGLEKMLDDVDRMFARMAGSPDQWKRRKAELMAGKRWAELVY